MVCIYCGNKTEVTNSRQKARLPSVWRRRACKVCVAQFTTFETPDYSLSVMVTSLNGSLVAFSRDKLFLSLYKSLGHRSKALDEATALTTTVIGRILKQSPAGAINPRELAIISHQTLKRFDNAAAASYKAYHKQCFTS